MSDGIKAFLLIMAIFVGAPIIACILTVIGYALLQAVYFGCAIIECTFEWIADKLCKTQDDDEQEEE